MPKYSVLLLDVLHIHLSITDFNDLAHSGYLLNTDGVWKERSRAICPILRLELKASGIFSTTEEENFQILLHMAVLSKVIQALLRTYFVCVFFLRLIMIAE